MDDKIRNYAYKNIEYLCNQNNISIEQLRQKLNISEHDYYYACRGCKNYLKYFTSVCKYLSVDEQDARDLDLRLPKEIQKISQIWLILEYIKQLTNDDIKTNYSKWRVSEDYTLEHHYYREIKLERYDNDENFFMILTNNYDNDSGKYEACAVLPDRTYIPIAGIIYKQQEYLVWKYFNHHFAKLADCVLKAKNISYDGWIIRHELKKEPTRNIYSIIDKGVIEELEKRFRKK